MHIFYHCVNTVLKECTKTGVAINKNLCKIENNIDVNFELPINRITFLYKFGTYSIYFFKKCFLEFAANYHDISFVLDKISSSELVCSLSNGPGIDIIGLQIALKELGRSFNEKTFFKIISKYGSWRNTMSNLIETSTSINPMIGTFKLMQCNVLGSLSSKAENCLKSADIVLIDHAFASPNAQKAKILATLKVSIFGFFKFTFKNRLI